MSEKNSSNQPTTNYESLYDLNLLSLYSLSGKDWSSMMQEEIVAATNQPIPEKSKSKNKVVLLSIFAILALLATTWFIALKSWQELQKVETSNQRTSDAITAN